MLDGASTLPPGRSAEFVNPPLFGSTDSLRAVGERRALAFSLLLAPLTLYVIGRFFPSITISEFALLAIGGLVYVALSRGRLLGSSVRIHETQFPEIFAIIEEVAARLEIVTPHVFVRDDPFVPITAIGTDAPYAIVISNAYVEHFTPGELRFVVARELAHIAAGHTRLVSMLTASGRENPVSALVLGAWLRRTEYTADRVGLLCSALDDALRAIAFTALHHVGRRVDLTAFADQQRQIERNSMLRLGEWTGAAPYATGRIEALAAFDRSDVAARWRARFAAAPVAPQHEGRSSIPQPIGRKELASKRRRWAALAVDVIAIIAAFHVSGFGLSASNGGKDVDVRTVWPTVLREIRTDIAHAVAGQTFVERDKTNVSINTGALLVYVPYAAVLVALAGQTLGMIVFDLRVSTTTGAGVGLWRSLARYTIALLTCWLALPLSLFARMLPHDVLSGTRLVRSSAVGRTMAIDPPPPLPASHDGARIA